MSNPVKISPEIVALVGTFGLPRTILVQFYTRLHDYLPRAAPELRRERDPEDGRLFRFRMPIPEGNLVHTIYCRVDDTTAPGSLILKSVRYERTELP